MILFDLHNADESIHHSLMYQSTSVKQVKRSEAKVSKVTDACFAVEYPLMDKPIHGAVIEISGRYPDIGFSRNEVCIELAYVISGRGKLG